LISYFSSSRGREREGEREREREKREGEEKREKREERREKREERDKREGERKRGEREMREGRERESERESEREISSCWTQLGVWSRQWLKSSRPGSRDARLTPRPVGREGASRKATTTKLGMWRAGGGVVALWLGEEGLPVVV